MTLNQGKRLVLSIFEVSSQAKSYFLSINKLRMPLFRFAMIYACTPHSQITYMLLLIEEAFMDMPEHVEMGIVIIDGEQPTRWNIK